jgi:HAD superfamily hydrolase (TIGR01509 family)
VKRSRFAARAVLFDWDGTLLDSYRSDSRAYLSMFRAMGIEWGMPELERNYSPNWHHVYRAAKLPRAMWDKADRLWHKAYEKESPALLPGARNVIRQLARRFTLGIVTSGTGWRVHEQLRDFKLGGYFAACVCAEDAGRRKPHSAPLNLALRRLKLRPAECVYVGDSPQDIEMSRRARVRVIGVRGPFPTAAAVLAARPDLMLGSIAELPDWIEDFD